MFTKYEAYHHCQHITYKNYKRASQLAWSGLSPFIVPFKLGFSGPFIDPIGILFLFVQMGLQRVSKGTGPFVDPIGNKTKTIILLLLFIQMGLHRVSKGTQNPD